MIPNVLCVGFAKCGTTTLYDIMKQHPDIYLSGIKEPIYFGNKQIMKNKGFEWYKKRYYPKKMNKKIIMEINPVIGKYATPDEIKINYGKDVKIIFMIRNPIKRLYSNFTMNLVKGDCFKNINDNIGNENLLFDKWVIDNFLDKNGNVISDDVIPKFCKSGNYYNTIKKYIDTFSSKNVKVIVFENFIKNPEKECKEIFEFIGIKNNNSINFNIFSNEGNRIPFNKLSIGITKISFKVWENFIIKKFKYVSYNFSNFFNNLIWNITRIFSKKTNKKEMSYCSKLILNNYYKDMCIKLSKLLNIDFINKWDINLNDISEEDKIVLKVKKKFEIDLIKINESYYKISKQYNLNKLKNIMEYHNDVVIKIIRYITTFFPQLNKSQFIALNGSFAAGLNIFDSDIDLTIFNNTTNVNTLLLEFKINYIIARTLDFKGIDRVHSIMVYTSLKYNRKYEIINNKVIFEEKKTTLCYFRDNYEQLLFETINTSRNYNVLLKYFDKKIKNNKYVYNWLNNFLLIKDFGEFKNFKKQVDKNIDFLTKNYSKEVINENIIKNIKEIDRIYNYSLSDVELVKNIKKYYKSDFTKILKNTIFTIKLINIKPELKEKLINKTMFILYKHLFVIMRIKIVLKEFNMDLSSHLNSEVNLKYFNKVSQKMFGVKNIFKYQKKYIKKTKRILERLVNINV